VNEDKKYFTIVSFLKDLDILKIKMKGRTIIDEMIQEHVFY